jgi:hypothetical protein
MRSIQILAGGLALLLGVATMWFGAFVQRHRDWYLTSTIGRNQAFRGAVSSWVLARSPETLRPKDAYVTGGLFVFIGLGWIVAGMGL